MRSQTDCDRDAGRTLPTSGRIAILLPSMVSTLERAYRVVNQYLLYAGNMQSNVSFGAQSGNSGSGKEIIQSYNYLLSLGFFVCLFANYCVYVET